MIRDHLWKSALVFFVTTGIGYSGSAIGAEPDAEAADTALTTEAGADVDAQGVEVSAFDTVSLNVNGAPLRDVIQLLSIQSRRNIVPSQSVEGTVVANLYDVTFNEALDAVLQQNGAGYVEKGNFIYIYTLEELREIQDANRKPIYRVVELQYMTATDASTFVQPLLSSAGSISVSGNVAPGIAPSIADAGADSSAHAHRMVIRDYEDNVEEIVKVVEQLDVPPMQVLVEATILKADVTEDLAFGVDFSILSDIAVDAFTNPLSGVGDLLTGTVQPNNSVGAISSTVGNVAGEGGLKVGVVTNNVAAFVRALDSVTDTTIVANPKLLALNRQRANVLVGEKIGYLSTTATATATTQTVEFLDTGTQLTVRPFASNDGMIRLEIKPSVSSARIREVIPGTNTAAVTIPDEITQELTTNVMVRDGQTVVLGGLFKEETTISRSQIPGLGDIPIAGNAFKGRDDQLVRSEVIFLITPHIVKDSPLYASGKAAKDGVEMARIGAREHLLPWSRSKLSAAHLREALKALEAGDRDKALWEVDLALGLDPKQIEAIRLKEKLTGQRTYFPDRSLLDEAVGVMIEKQTGQVAPTHRQVPMQPSPRPAKPLTDVEPASPEAAEESIERQHTGTELINDLTLRRVGYPPLTEEDEQPAEDRNMDDMQSTAPSSEPKFVPVPAERIAPVQTSTAEPTMFAPVVVELESEADWDEPIEVLPPIKEDQPADAEPMATEQADESTDQLIESMVESVDVAEPAPAVAEQPAEPAEVFEAPVVVEDPAADEAVDAEVVEADASNEASESDSADVERLEDSPFAVSDVEETEAEDSEQPEDATATVPVK